MLDERSATRTRCVFFYSAGGIFADRPPEWFQLVSARFSSFDPSVFLLLILMFYFRKEIFFHKCHLVDNRVSGNPRENNQSIAKFLPALLVDVSSNFASRGPFELAVSFRGF